MISLIAKDFWSGARIWIQTVRVIGMPERAANERGDGSLPLRQLSPEVERAMLEKAASPRSHTFRPARGCPLLIESQCSKRSRTVRNFPFRRSYPEIISGAASSDFIAKGNIASPIQIFVGTRISGRLDSFDKFRMIAGLFEGRPPTFAERVPDQSTRRAKASLDPEPHQPYGCLFVQ